MKTHCCRSCDCSEVVLKDRGALDSEAAKRTACHPTVAIEFKNHEWLDAIEFIPVGHNGYGDLRETGRTYLNVNVYKQLDRGPNKGKRDSIDARTSLSIEEAEYLIRQLTNAVEAMKSTVEFRKCCCACWRES